jgi:hypothetical protein
MLKVHAYELRAQILRRMPDPRTSSYGTKLSTGSEKYFTKIFFTNSKSENVHNTATNARNQSGKGKCPRDNTSSWKEQL